MEIAIFICVLANLVVSLAVLVELRVKRRIQFSQLTDAVEASAGNAARAMRAAEAVRDVWADEPARAVEAAEDGEGAKAAGTVAFSAGYAPSKPAAGTDAVKAGVGYLAAGGVSDALIDTCVVLGDECGLTAREREVLVQLACGYNCHSIADKLSISESTVKSHSLKIYRKLGVHSQQEVIALVRSRLTRSAVI